MAVACFREKILSIYCQKLPSNGNCEAMVTSPTRRRLKMVSLHGVIGALWLAYGLRTVVPTLGIKHIHAQRMDLNFCSFTYRKFSFVTTTMCNVRFTMEQKFSKEDLLKSLA